VQAILLTYLVVSIVMIILSVPLLRRQVKPGFFYGYRMPVTLGKPDIWYNVGAYVGRLLVATAVVVALAATSLYLFGGLDVKDYATDCAVILLIGLFVSVGLGWRYMLSLTSVTPKENNSNRR
jgi:SdpI/YfhL protein family